MTERLIDALNGAYRCSNLIGNYNRHTQINLLNNEVFEEILNISIDLNKEFFLPIINLENTITWLLNHIPQATSDNTINLYYPLYSDSYNSRRTGEAIISCMLYGRADHRLVDVTSPKGFRAYGGNGILLNSEKKLIIMMGFRCKYENSKLNIIRPECFISPELFISNDLLSKLIKKDVIWYISSHCLDLPNVFYRYSNIDTEHCQHEATVIVENISEYIITPRIPNSATVSEDLWEVLNNNTNIINDI